LIGRGLIEGPNLRDNLLSRQKIVRDHGALVRAALIEIVATSIGSMIAGEEHGRRYPGQFGTA
jgi:hypothetical protein